MFRFSVFRLITIVTVIAAFMGMNVCPIRVWPYRYQSVHSTVVRNDLASVQYGWPLRYCEAIQQVVKKDNGTVQYRGDPVFRYDSFNLAKNLLAGVLGVSLTIFVLDWIKSLSTRSEKLRTEPSPQKIG